MGDSYGRVTVAAVQAAPAVLDRDATLAKLGAGYVRCSYIHSLRPLRSPASLR